MYFWSAKMKTIYCNKKLNYMEKNNNNIVVKTSPHIIHTYMHIHFIHFS